jgi:uncharacterized protein (TIGR02679 family)
VTDTARLERLFGGPDLEWLVERVRARLERGEDASGVALLSTPSEQQRAAVARLLGKRPSQGAALRVPLAEVEAVLRRAGVAGTLGEAVVALRGPLADRAVERQAEERAWAAAFAEVEAAVSACPALVAWRDDLRATGTLRRLAKGDPQAARRMLRDVAAVLDRLPVPPVPRSVLAAEVLGDGHALDDGRPVATLMLRAARLLGGVPDGSGAEWRREVWASVGVLVGDLTAPVLTLSLPGDVRSVTGRALAAWAEAGQPAHLTLRQLIRHPPRLALTGRDVFVCENPTVVAAAADLLGPRCAPLACVSGHPSAAANALLRLLAGAGARLRYHGDFDWGGLTIANALFTRFPAAPWRYDTDAYRGAAERTAAAAARLTGAPVTAVWDPDLTPAMQAAGHRVEEEHVLDDLLADLDAVS